MVVFPMRTCLAYFYVTALHTCRVASLSLYSPPCSKDNRDKYKAPYPMPILQSAWQSPCCLGDLEHQYTQPGHQPAAPCNPEPEQSLVEYCQ